MKTTTTNQTTKSRKAYKYITIAFIAALISVSSILGLNRGTVQASTAEMAPALSVANDVNTAHETPNAVEAINEEPAKYSFASIQMGSNLEAPAGGQLNEQIGFYNVDGNRTTHITLKVTGAPDGWEVEVDSQISVEVTELVSEPVKDPEEGIKSVVLGDRGYTTANIANITIQVPEDAEEGTMGEIRITATAEWYGQTGQVVICQTRSFDYSVNATK